MKANELRLGNYLQDSITKTTLEVIQLNNTGIYTYVIDRSKYPLKEGWKLEPIPLTEEWLLKFGLQKRYGSSLFGFTANGYTIEIDLNKKEVHFNFDEYTGFAVNFNYVHHLQNLYFALTGEELTLEP